jgi:hydrogenase nickel incorporation protein HypA/HybF
MSIAQSIAEICEQSAGGRRVLAVVLEIGELSNIMPESLEFCFDACTRDTLLDGARLEIVRIPGRGRCASCAGEFPLKALYDPCPACGGYGVEIVAGEEMTVKELEVE